MSSSPKKKYVAVGTGGRIPMFIDPLVRDYADENQLVGLCDNSQTRMNYHQQRLLKEFGYGPVPTYLASDFERMIGETGADTVIVTTPDFTHREYVVRALAIGCDIVVEKPVATDAEGCNDILRAIEQSGRQVRVAFNFRWAPGPSRVRELVAAGTIGRIHAVNLEYQLNTSHGADYFRRWHATKEYSGGLLVHKSTHHFDLVNWWLDAVPEQVFAYGGLKFYGRENALRRGEQSCISYERYTGACNSQDDPFAFDLEKNPQDRELYLNAEAESGYIRDRNVFREGIDIEDTMSALVKYRTGEVLNYSLVAYSPQEGFRVTLTGDKGRIEYTERFGSHILEKAGEGVSPAEGVFGDHSTHLLVIPMFQCGYEVPVLSAFGGHGGADPLLQQQIFSASAPAETLGRNAQHEQGMASALVGIAANRSMESNHPVNISNLCALAPNARHLSELK